MTIPPEKSHITYAMVAKRHPAIYLLHRCIFFKDIEELFNRLSKKESLEITSIKSILKRPVEIRDKQEVLDKYI